MTNLQPQTERGNTAGEMLAGWAVTIDRDTLTALLTSQNFPALLALSPPWSRGEIEAVRGAPKSTANG